MSNYTPADEWAALLKGMLSTPIPVGSMSVRAQNALDNQRVVFLGDLARLEPGQVLRWKHVGAKTLREFEAMLESHGLSFGMDVGDWSSHRIPMQMESVEARVLGNIESGRRYVLSGYVSVSKKDLLWLLKRAKGE